MNPARAQMPIGSIGWRGIPRVGFSASFLLALASVGLVGLAGGGCALPAQAFGEEAPAKNEQNTANVVGKVEARLRAEIAALKQENQQAATASSGGYAKTTQVMGMTGLACMVAMLAELVAMVLIVRWIVQMFAALLEKILPLINADEHGKPEITAA